MEIMKSNFYGARLQMANKAEMNKNRGGNSFGQNRRQKRGDDDSFKKHLNACEDR